VVNAAAIRARARAPTRPLDSCHGYWIDLVARTDGSWPSCTGRLTVASEIGRGISATYCIMLLQPPEPETDSESGIDL
jgi:hypothetical protein